MYCPNCGNTTSSEQSFCRTCGLGLEKIAQSLDEQLPAKLDKTLQDRKDKIERLGVAALSVFGLGILGLILYGIVYRVILVQGRVLEGVGLLGFIILVACGLLSVYLFAKADEVKKAQNTRLATQSGELTEKRTTAKLLPDDSREPVASVTERTTDFLLAEKRRDRQES